jgi:ribosomal protein S18 acetylase RimI-like enzyme
VIDAQPQAEPIAIAPLPPSDLPAAIRLLARAFRDNPLNRAVLRRRGAAARQRSNEHGMRAHLPVALGSGRLLGAQRGGALAGVLIAAPPWSYPFPRPSAGARLRCLLGQGLGVASHWAQVYAALDQRHPREEHWYLGTLGVDPDRWGRGVGTALLARWLAEVDRDALPAWLETDRERNVGFYQRAGFGVEEQIEVLGVPIWLMRRAAASSPDRG